MICWEKTKKKTDNNYSILVHLGVGIVPFVITAADTSGRMKGNYVLIMIILLMKRKHTYIQTHKINIGSQFLRKFWESLLPDIMMRVRIFSKFFFFFKDHKNWKSIIHNERILSMSVWAVGVPFVPHLPTGPLLSFTALLSLMSMLWRCFKLPTSIGNLCGGDCEKNIKKKQYLLIDHKNLQNLMVISWNGGKRVREEINVRSFN